MGNTSPRAKGEKQSRLKDAKPLLTSGSPPIKSALSDEEAAMITAASLGDITELTALHERGIRPSLDVLLVAVRAGHERAAMLIYGWCPLKYAKEAVRVAREGGYTELAGKLDIASQGF
jgi:hypothetical protein